MANIITSKNMSAKKKHKGNAAAPLRIALTLFFMVAAGVHALAQVSTQTELGTSKQASQSMPGYFFYAKPFEVTMTINLWGEVPQQGVYIIPTNTDIVQLISFAGGPKERSNLEEVLVYRASPKKEQKERILLKVNVRDILEGKASTLPLAPGDMIVVKRLSESLTWDQVLTIVNAGVSLAILGISIYNLTKK